jgi:SNF2 family DNA or RNA helicase
MTWDREFMFPAWDHQTKEFEEHKDDHARALHWQMRTGKTKAMIDLACYLHKTGKIDGVLILGPNNVHANWVRREIPAHHWLGVSFRSLAWNSGLARRKDFELSFKDLLEAKGIAWYAVNVEATTLKLQLPFINAFMKRRKFLLVTDETHEWRRPGSKRSQFVRNKIRDKAVVRRNLSGTMVDNNPMHAWAQYEILEKSALGHKDFKTFELHYGEWSQRTIYTKSGQRRIPHLEKFRNLDELRSELMKWTSYVYRDQCDDLPELVLGKGEFELTGQQKRVYNELVNGELIKLDSGEHLDVDTDGLITKLQMIRSGFVRDAEGETLWLIDHAVNPAFCELLEQIKRTDGKVIVWCRFRLEIETIMALLKKDGIKAVNYYGGTKTADRAKHEDRFRSDPEVKVMVAQPKACGQGLDFSAGEHIIWFSHTHGDLIGRRQADERCTKMGGRKIAVTDMIGIGTVDEKILADQDVKVNLTEYLTGQGLRDILKAL